MCEVTAGHTEPLCDVWSRVSGGALLLLWILVTLPPDPPETHPT